MLFVTGYNTTIVAALRQMIPAGEPVVRFTPNCDVGHQYARQLGGSEATRWVFAAGVLHAKPIAEQAWEETILSLAVNMTSVVKQCEQILRADATARICIVGSESGFAGSYDTTYAMAKAGVHRYVETRPLEPGQQLVAVAPSIIGDSGMTARREDTENLERRRTEHPKRRFLTPGEVAAMIHHLLYVDAGYTSGVVVRMNGGAHICRK